MWNLVLILIYRGPWARRGSRIRPAGRAAGRRAFFDSTGMCCRKTPRNPRTRRVAPGATDGVCFLLVIFSLHKQRKVTRSRQRAKPRPSGKPCRQPSYRIVFEQMRNRSLACSSGSQVLIEFAKPDDPSRKNVGSPQAQARHTMMG